MEWNNYLIHNSWGIIFDGPEKNRLNIERFWTENDMNSSCHAMRVGLFLVECWTPSKIGPPLAAVDANPDAISNAPLSLNPNRGLEERKATQLANSSVTAGLSVDFAAASATTVDQSNFRNTSLVCRVRRLEGECATHPCRQPSIPSRHGCQRRMSENEESGQLSFDAFTSRRQRQMREDAKKQ